MEELPEVQADTDSGCRDPSGRLDRDHRDPRDQARDLQDTEDPMEREMRTEKRLSSHMEERKINNSSLHLDLVLDELLGVVDLLRVAADGKQFEVGVSVGRRLARDLHERACLLVDGLDVLASSADHQAALVGGDREGHLAAGGTPVTGTTPPATPTTWRHTCARRTRRSLKE